MSIDYKYFTVVMKCRSTMRILWLDEKVAKLQVDEELGP